MNTRMEDEKIKKNDVKFSKTISQNPNEVQGGKKRRGLVTGNKP